jgi:FKBP-type peptidyl-prolyl cis-trans isomerase SlyD
MKVEKDKVVSIHYKLTINDGEVVDSSEGKEPLAYIHGNGHLIPGLEEDLDGKEAGYKNNVKVTPEKGYGERHEEMIQTLDKSQFGENEVEVGMKFNAQGAQGPQVVTITKVEGSEVTIDGNHELAGVTLNFDVEIVEVRDSNPDELEHGHVHGPGGHEH